MPLNTNVSKIKSKEIFKKRDKNRNATYQNIWDTAKVVLEREVLK